MPYNRHFPTNPAVKDPASLLDGRKKDSLNPHVGRDFVQFRKTESVLNKGAKRCPLIQPTFGSFLNNYLQMYDSYWDKEKKESRSKSVMAFGYAQELISEEIPDPIAFYKEYVKQKEAERAASLADETRPRTFGSPMEKYAGHFLLRSLLEELSVKETIDILASQMRFQFSIYDMMAQLVYARVLCPCSKSKTASAVFPHLYGSAPISEDQVYDGCSFIGASVVDLVFRNGRTAIEVREDGGGRF